MVRLFRPIEKDRHGSLVVEPRSSSSADVFYMPPAAQLEQSGLNPTAAAAHRVQIMQIDSGKQRITMFPINTRGGHRAFLKSKYDQIERITLVGRNVVYLPSEGGAAASSGTFVSPSLGPTEPLDEDIGDIDLFPTVPSDQQDIMMILEELPSAFVKDFDYGLGLARRYRFIIEAVERLSDCRELVITHERETSIEQDEGIFYISDDDFDATRKSLDRITDNSTNAAFSVKQATSHNFLAVRVGQQEIAVNPGRHPLRKLFTGLAQDEASLSGNEQEMVLDVVSKNVKSLAETSPEKIVKLHEDIELVALNALITRYEEMMGKKLQEGMWQTFLNSNPFILSLAFGYPIIKIQDHASVGGRKLHGGGGKIADFVVKNSMTHNTAIVEIKTPQEKLLNVHPYRDGVYTPSSALSGSINQTLDQKYHFEREIVQIRGNSQIGNFESYSVHCCLIVGTMPLLEERRKSFELFRGNSKSVEILTFDELLYKLRQLRDFLTTAEEELAAQTQPVEVPF